ncbi:hypothetical protein [Ruegeria arenilitoris]|uniref:hypothetical protein n=1 Tax=Ruegeria arenilitoris TaxID=1173585 RepID=UPI00147ADADE|nr:hypothetical protein [Ruegeria arenilitoris]
MSQRRITLTIDRIVTDDPSLDRTALTKALTAEVRARLAQDGMIGAAGAPSSATVRTDRGTGSATEQIAKATLRGIRR